MLRKYILVYHLQLASLKAIYFLHISQVPSKHKPPPNLQIIAKRTRPSWAKSSLSS